MRCELLLARDSQKRACLLGGYGGRKVDFAIRRTEMPPQKTHILLRRKAHFYARRRDSGVTALDVCGPSPDYQAAASGFWGVIPIRRPRRLGPNC